MTSGLSDENITFYLYVIYKISKHGILWFMEKMFNLIILLKSEKEQGFFSYILQ
uniref:Uncharacterized protein n=1 Tax=Anguilla anguilla TaxID=7936 RepID=A0A0E9UPX9_ANGAN